MSQDIRATLKERIKALEAELAVYQRALEHENMRFGAAPEAFGPASTGTLLTYKLSDMPKVILDLLKSESLDKPELIKRVAAIDPFSKLDAPGRNVHAQLTNLIRSGKVEKKGEKYVLRPE